MPVLLLLVMTMAAAPGLHPQLWLLLLLPCDRPPEPLTALWLSGGSVAALRLPPPLALPPAALLPAPSGRYTAAPLGDTHMLGTPLP